MQKNKIFCTIFTPTYNRGELLERLYDSLLSQNDKNFEWLIVDDGSTDDTEKKVNGWIAKKKIQINYIKQENGGKHRAINTGIDHAKGEVFAIVDSDDYLTQDAVLKIKEKFELKKKKKDAKYAGIAFQRGYSQMNPIGDSFNNAEYVDAKNTERRRYNIDGDKFEIYYTNVLKKFKFPEIENEKFMTEAVVWTRIAHAGYYIRWYNDVLYLCNYLEGGLTDCRDKLIEKCPKGYALYIREQKKFGDITLKQKLGYYSYYANIRKKKVSLREIANELDTSSIMIRFACFLRKINVRLRGKNE